VAGIGQRSCDARGGIPAGILPWNEVKDGSFCLSVILDETVGICVMTREQARYSMRPLKGGLPG
jgi:hypothetical protein